MFLLSKTCYSLLAFARFERLLSVLFCFRWNYSVYTSTTFQKNLPCFAFRYFLCWISSSIGHVFLYAPSFLIIRLEFTRKCLQFFYSWVFLSISFVFLSIVSRFLCNFLDVMQFSRYNSIASLFGNFFEHLLRSFSHVFLYAPSLAHWFSSNFLKNACNIFLKVEPSKLNSSLFSP